ncbi:putative inactive cytochrome P450 family member 4Z2 [Balaenoptera ricei]|uniref:putative inactive cytochrome P450 family member 4Z2 n=1 Tax=Balaenoptera ricei TaxID=2746895 RepID=UPI0028BD4C58|nr:putative inactive cytochrome P450 family member 4Z2 [Balaenoptera ricei]
MDSQRGREWRLTASVYRDQRMNLLQQLRSSRTFQFYLEAVFNLTKLTHQHMYSLLYHKDLIFKFSSQGHIFSKSSQVVHQYTENS